ncbi:MAG: hypothetical protein ACYC91_20300 [Solirubrobacteraceae bacterium]
MLQTKLAADPAAEGPALTDDGARGEVITPGVACELFFLDAAPLTAEIPIGA